MGLYEQFVLPWVLHCACASPAITAQRKKIVPLASGTVLEVGMGTGLNLKYYTAETTDLVHGLEPSAPMRRRAQNVATQMAFEVNIIDGVAEQIPLPDGSVDTVMLTFTLCTLPDPHTALHEMARVLTDTGTLLFCEHGLAPDATVASVQMRLNPFGNGLLEDVIFNETSPIYSKRQDLKSPSDTKDTCLEPHVLQDITTGVRQRN